MQAHLWKKGKESSWNFVPSFTAPGAGDDLIAAVNDVGVAGTGRSVSLDDLAAQTQTAVLRSMQLPNREGFHSHL